MTLSKLRRAAFAAAATASPSLSLALDMTGAQTTSAFGADGIVGWSFDVSTDLDVFGPGFFGPNLFVAAPEPGTFGLAGVALAASVLSYLRRRRKQDDELTANVTKS